MENKQIKQVDIFMNRVARHAGTSDSQEQVDIADIVSGLLTQVKKGELLDADYLRIARIKMCNSPTSVYAGIGQFFDDYQKEA